MSECHCEVLWLRIFSGGCTELSLKFPVHTQYSEWGFSWPWCCCVTAEGASAIPQERRRVLGVTESRFQYAFICALLQQGDRRLSLMQRITHYSINAERSLWKRGLFLFVIWWRFWSYKVWGKKLYLVTRSPWELVTMIGRGGFTWWVQSCSEAMQEDTWTCPKRSLQFGILMLLVRTAAAWLEVDLQPSQV